MMKFSEAKECPKCGFRSFDIIYRNPGGGRNTPNWLKFICRRCGYYWLVQPKDEEPQPDPSLLVRNTTTRFTQPESGHWDKCSDEVMTNDVHIDTKRLDILTDDSWIDAMFQGHTFAYKPPSTVFNNLAVLDVLRVYADYLLEKEENKENEF